MPKTLKRPKPAEPQSLQDILDCYSVDGPENRAEAVEANPDHSWPEGWSAVSDENGGYVAYFLLESDAAAFRLMLVNARQNLQFGRRYE